MHSGHAPHMAAFTLALAAACTAALLPGCGGSHRSRSASGTAQQLAAEAVVDRDLASAADSVTADLAALTGSRQRYGIVRGGASGRLYAPGTLVYDGPLEEALARACAETGMRLHVAGKAPDVPVIVHVHMTDKPWLHIFRAIGMQTGPGARVRLSEPARRVELNWGA